jgi:hypothetical protein
MPWQRGTAEIQLENKTIVRVTPMSLMGHDSLIGGSGAAACGWKDYRNIEQKQLIPQDAQHLPIRFSLAPAVLLCHLGKL